MKKPKVEDFYLNGDRIELDHAAFTEAKAKYEAYKAEKAKSNKEYRARRTKREQEAVAKAAALKANRDLDPTREEWLMRAAGAILKQVAEAGYIPTGDVKVSFAPLGAASRKKMPCMGVCYHAAASEGGYREIFIDASLTDTRVILGTLTHEIGHAVLADKVGHRKPFKVFCEAVGFDFRETGKAEHASDGDEWWGWANLIARDLGEVPHKKLNTTSPQGEKKKQTTRMIKCECPDCGAIYRTTRKVVTAISADWSFLNCANPGCAGQINIADLEIDLDGGDEEE